MENERNNPSSSPSPVDNGNQPMPTPEEEIQRSSGAKVDPLPELLDSVEFALRGTGRYPQFRHFLNDLQRGREAVQARSKIEEILNYHQELLTQFRTLFPEDEVLQPPQPVDEQEKATQFYRKVQDRFQGDERYNVFTRIMNDFVTETKISKELYDEPSNHVNGNGIDLSSVGNKKRKDIFSHGTEDDGCLPGNPNSDSIQDAEIHPIEPPWMSEFAGVMRNVYGPVTAAKTIYEDEEGYLIAITLPFADPERVKVHWWNNLTHGIVKISSVSTACMPFIQRNDRTFKLTDPSPEHCPPGEFKREIRLSSRIPDDAKLEAYFDKSGTVLEIEVPKHRTGPEEHEVPVCLRPSNEFGLS